VRTIVLVDDDPDIQESIKIVLEKAGFIFRGALDRKSGMSLIKKENPDLVILDVMMEEPDDGFFMAQELHAQNIKVPIIMLTSIGSVTGMRYAKDNEMIMVDEFVEKPVTPDILIGKINGLLENGKD
jgi:DNA-binding response OmpR family regulator